VAKTGLEVLTDLVDQIRQLNQRIDLLDQNVKTLMNQARAQPVEKTAQKPQLQAFTPPPPKPGKMTIQSDRPKKDGVMANGKLVVLIDNKPTPIPDAAIKIFNDKDQVVRETKTNRGGIWMAMLAPGRYVVEIAGKYKGKDLVTQNKNFIIPQDAAKEFEVT
jgi:hypothetical protein